MIKRRLKVIFLRSNPVSPDPRVEKEAEVVSEIAKVRIIAWDREAENPVFENLPYGSISRFRLKAPYGRLILVLTLPIWFFYLLFKLLFADFDIIHACDFDTYLPALIVAKIRKKKIVYDIFDFYADMSGLNNFIANPIAWLDRKLMVKADLVILADEYRLKQIKPAQPKNLIYIYNIPHFDAKLLNKWRLKRTRKNYFIYAGSLATERMLEKLLRFFGKNERLIFEAAGWGPLTGLVKDWQTKTKNIKYLGKIDYQKVLDKTAEATVSFAFYSPKIKNHIYASPNKLFEAIALQKPIITNRGTSLARFVENNQIGLTINYGNMIQFQKALSKLTNPKLQRQIKEKCAKLYFHDFNWNKMKQRLTNAYLKIINSS